MKDSPSNQVPSHSPEKLENLKISRPKKKAAGLPAVGSSLKHVKEHMRTGDALKLSLAINQKEGFDCPGCAWPDPDDDRSKLGEYCENGIKAIAEEATKRSIGASFFAQHSVQELGEMSDFELGKLGRLTEPMILSKGASHYEPISWKGAFQRIADKLNGLASPDEALFYTSGRTSNEAAYLYQLFVRDYGTNNLPDCSNMCHESSGVALSETLGIGKGSVTLQDLHEAEVIMVMGQNPGTNHPRMLSALEKCKQNGGKIITVNPLPEAGLMNFINPQSIGKLLSGGTVLTDIFLPVRINGDVAFLKALMYLLWEKEQQAVGTVFDQAFIDTYTQGYEAFLEEIKQVDLEECLELCGLYKKDLLDTAELFVKHDKIIICWAMGLTQHENGVGNIKEVVNLLLLKGAVGKPGAGTCPVRGHSNVQGDRTMGIWEAPKTAFLDKLEEVHKIKAPREHGLATVPAIQAMHEGKAKVFFAMGGNFLSAAPDTAFTAKALQNCELTVQVSTKLNRSHLITGEEALILPCLGRTDKDIQQGTEQFISCENSMGVVQSSKGILTPPSTQLKSEISIIAELAAATLPDSPVDYLSYAASYDRIREAISQVIPGFENYNERVREVAGFYLPNGARKRVFNTASGKAQFSVIPLPPPKQQEGTYLMMTIRSHDQFNTTIYGMDDRYRGIQNERRVILMNEGDMKERGWEEKTIVHLYSQHKGIKREALTFQVVPYPIPRGNVATYFPEANPLVPIDLIARKSKTPVSKCVPITIEKA